MKSASALVFVVALLTLATAWAFTPVLDTLRTRWATDPQYAHGYLVPIIALYMMYCRTSKGTFVPPNISWHGLPLLALGGLTLIAGGFLRHDWISGVALVPLALGCVFTITGIKAWREVWPACFFLVFMIPLPYRVEVALSAPLRSLATSISTVLLQIFGVTAVAQGNTIQLDVAKVSVAEACSGLSMFLTFFAIATAFVFITNLPKLESCVLILSAPVIAVFANVLRIVVTALVLDSTDSAAFQKFMHDFAGWLMMPVAAICFWLELKLIQRAFPLEDDRDLLGATLAKSRT